MLECQMASQYKLSPVAQSPNPILNFVERHRYPVADCQLVIRIWRVRYSASASGINNDSDRTQDDYERSKVKLC